MLPFGNFLLRLRAEYPDDPTSPGVTCAVLREGVFYFAVKRYRGTFGAGEYTVAKAKHADFDEALRVLEEQWRYSLSKEQSLDAVPRRREQTIGDYSKRDADFSEMESVTLQDGRVVPRKKRKLDKSGRIVTYDATILYIDGQRVGASGMKVNFEVAKKRDPEPERPAGIASRFRNLDMDDEELGGLPEATAEKPRGRSGR